MERLLRMFSTEVGVREEQLSQALRKQLLAGVAVQASKKLVGKLVRLEQYLQAYEKLVPLDALINGKFARDLH